MVARALQSRRVEMPLFEHDAALLGELIDEELATIASYAEAIDRSESAYLTTTLRQLRDSHAARVRLLIERIEALGHRHRPAVPPASTLEGRATTRAAASDKTVIAGLLEVEDRLQARYRAIRSRLASETQHFLDGRIMTEERWGHFEIRELAHQVHPATVTPPWAPAPRG